MDFWTDSIGPGAEEAFEGRQERQAFGIEAPMVLVVEDAANTGALVNGKHIGGGKTDVVIFEDESALHALG